MPKSTVVGRRLVHRHRVCCFTNKEALSHGSLSLSHTHTHTHTHRHTGTDTGADHLFSLLSRRKEGADKTHCMVKMLGRSLMNVGLRVKCQQLKGIQRVTAGLNPANYGDILRREAASTSTVMGVNKMKTMDDLGGPSFMTTLYWLFIKGYFQTTQQMQIEHSKIYGPLWKSKYGPLVVVNVASADMIEQVLRQEGKHPIRTDMPHWRNYRELRNQAHGPLTEMGAKWQRIRSILNPRMLKPKHVSSYANTINEVVSDFICRVNWLRETSGQGVMVNDLTAELYKFAFEGICSVLFETRMGCMNEVIPEKTQKFIVSVGEMFHLSQVVILFPQFLWPYLKSWKRFVAAWDHLFKVAEELVNKKIEEIQENVHLDKDVEGAYLTHLLLSEQMSSTEILGSITELLLAGVDTVSNSYTAPSFPIPKINLFVSIFPEPLNKNRFPLYKNNPLPLTLDRDTVIGKQFYFFYSTSNFYIADSGARWLRGGEDKSKHHPFGSVPFGFGIRACLGRRVAELEMHLLLSRVRTSVPNANDAPCLLIKKQLLPTQQCTLALSRACKATVSSLAQAAEWIVIKATRLYI
uniref:Cytochrome P450 family 27 subfamily A member 3 n=1 Tax=Neolamprologus brichardi TaxID=32507 RepID=A0A3Q4M3A0_NEOBR